MTRPTKMTTGDLDLSAAPARLPISDVGIWVNLAERTLDGPAGVQELEPQHALVLHRIVYFNSRGVRPSSARLAALCQTTPRTIHKVISELRLVLEPVGAEIPHSKSGYQVVAGMGPVAVTDGSGSEPNGPELPPSSGPSTLPEAEPPKIGQSVPPAPEGQPASVVDVPRRERQFAHRIALLSVIALCIAAVPPLIIDSRLTSHLLGPRSYPAAPYALSVILPATYGAVFVCMQRVRPMRRAAVVFGCTLLADVLLLPFYRPEWPHAHVLLMFGHVGVYLALGVGVHDYPAREVHEGSPSSSDARGVEQDHDRSAWLVVLGAATAVIIVVAVLCATGLPPLYQRQVSTSEDLALLGGYVGAQVCMLVSFYFLGAPLPQIMERAFSGRRR